MPHARIFFASLMALEGFINPPVSRFTHHVNLAGNSCDP